MEPDLEFDQSLEKCPSCGTEIQRAAVLCVHCGFHLIEARHLATAVDGEEQHRRPKPKHEIAQDTLPKHVVRKAEAVAKDAELLYVAGALSVLSCGVGAFAMLPWYAWRLRTWRQLNDNYDALQSSLSAHGELAVRFQKAWGRLVTGVAVGAVLWGWVIWMGVRALSWSAVSHVEVDMTRHAGEGRIVASPYNFSLVPPAGWTRGKAEDSVLAFRGPVDSWNQGFIGAGFAANFTLAAGPGPRTFDEDKFPVDIANQILSGMPPDHRLVSSEFVQVDDKPAYWLSTEFKPDRLGNLRMDQYYIIGHRRAYTLTLMSVADRYEGNRWLFDKVLASIRID